MSNLDPSANFIDDNDVAEINELDENYLDPSVYNPYHNLQDDDGNLGQIGSHPPIQPLPLPIKRRNVSGRYRGRLGNFELELRIDVDGKRPLKKVSGDFYQFVGLSKIYFGSFVINDPIITYGLSNVRIEGMKINTFGSSYNYVKISIPKNFIFVQPGSATIRFFSSANGTAGSTYICPFESIYFRTVRYEQDRVAGITPFSSYNTELLPSGGPSRILSVEKAYAESGVEMINTGKTNIVSTATIGSSWSDSELHAAMVNNFSIWTNNQDWKVWLLEAMLHDIGPGLYGIMFDQQGAQRQGCAVFHNGIGGSTADKQRLQLYTYVHELGHCFNLLHSWQKHLGTPSVPSRPSSLSWMNYPWNSAFGSPSNFWSKFAFQFDNQELIHIRHAFRKNIIMGGSDFAVGSALQNEHFNEFQDAIENNSGLNLRIEARKSYAFGEPVVLDIKLLSYDVRDKIVNGRIHPNFDYIRIAIQKPNNETFVYEPLMEHLAIEDLVTLNQTKPAIYDSAYIGFGKKGFTFDQTGFYTIKAAYLSLDGTPIVSNEISVRIKSPVTNAEDEIADLYFGNDQGHLFYLLGSDSKSLQNGNNAFDLVLDKYSKNTLSSYAALVKGINASRNFKLINADKSLVIRNSDEALNQKMISNVVSHSKGNEGIDNITLNMAMMNMAKCQKANGNEKASNETISEMIGIFEKKGLRKEVISDINETAKI